MKKKIWISPEVIVLGVENTEGTYVFGKNHDGEYLDPCHWWQLHS
jgi:hypothetical protein